MTKHTMTAEVEVKFTPTGCTEMEVSYPTLEIEFRYLRGRPAYTPRGEYAPTEPPEGAEVELVGATIVENPDGLSMDYAPDSYFREKVKDWAQNYLESDHGYERACEVAKEQGA